MAWHTFAKYHKTAAMVASRSFADQQYIGLLGDSIVRLLRVLLLGLLRRSGFQVLQLRLLDESRLWDAL